MSSHDDSDSLLSSNAYEVVRGRERSQTIVANRINLLRQQLMESFHRNQIKILFEAEGDECCMICLEKFSQLQYTIQLISRQGMEEEERQGMEG